MSASDSGLVMRCGGKHIHAGSRPARRFSFRQSTPPYFPHATHYRTWPTTKRWHLTNTTIIAFQIMSCDSCRKKRKELFDVIESAWKEYRRSNNIQLLQQRRKLCGYCMIGKSIPVRRRNNGIWKGRWQIGEVKQFICPTKEHLVQFDESDEEVVSVSAAPFSDYVANYPTEPHSEKTAAPGLPGDDNVISAVSPIRYKFEASDHLTFYNEAFSFDKGSVTDVQQGTTQSALTLDPIDTSFEETYGESPIHDAVSITWMSPYTDTFKGEDVGDETDAPHLPNREWSHVGPDDGASRNVEEDQTLFDSIGGQAKATVQPSDLSQSTGKVCRERCLNTLQLKMRRQKLEWSPTEDAMICHLHTLCGSKWTMIAKLLRGRTENAVIRRKLEKLLSSEEHHGKPSTNRHDKEKRSLAVDYILALRIKPSLSSSSSPPEWQYEYGHSFGPFNKISSFDSDNPGICTVICQRCSLLVPSKQTGRLICRRTGWCENCTSLLLSVKNF